MVKYPEDFYTLVMANTTNNAVKLPQECSALKSCIWKVIWMFGNEEEWIEASGEQFGVGNNLDIFVENSSHRSTGRNLGAATL